jgi:hypothetical protein
MIIVERSRHESSSRFPRCDNSTNGGGLIAEAVLAAAITASQKTVLHGAAQIPQQHQRFAACVSNRESHGNYRAKGDVSSARGRWQFLDHQWRSGLSFMVRDRLVTFGMPKAHAGNIRRQLLAKPIDKWTPVLQDIAFVSVITHRDGWRHWYIAGSKCNALAVK